ncbi:MAG: M23 family metallopeptidase [Ruminococcaceae bacterium]|nr:M23 family metallopeptidase [Oscillospiraceae bacterium]
MKYVRKKSNKAEFRFSDSKKRKPAKKIILAFFLFPIVLSLIAGMITHNQAEITENMYFFRSLGKDIAMYVSKKLPPVSKIGKKGADFCFEYIRGKKDERVPVTSVTDETHPSIMSIADVSEKSTQVKAESGISEDEISIDEFLPIMPCNGTISSPFGKRVHPLSGEETSHNGIDIAIDSGTEVCAIEDGVVQKSEYNQFSGNFVVIEHIGGYTSSYAHLSESKAKEGDTVKKGNVIGISGSTGAVTGPHLHMEIRKDSSPVDPMTLIKVN